MLAIIGDGMSVCVSVCLSTNILVPQAKIIELHVHMGGNITHCGL